MANWQPLVEITETSTQVANLTTLVLPRSLLVLVVIQPVQTNIKVLKV